MYGELSQQQINNLLSSQAIGRIGCTDGKRPYIVPVTYVFDGTYIYGQTQRGMKLEIMRKNPEVCFQVDVVLGMRHWQSALVRGRFEELTGKHINEKQDYLLNRMMPIMTSSFAHGHQEEAAIEIADDNRIKAIMYRIRITEKTGRYENL